MTRKDASLPSEMSQPPIGDWSEQFICLWIAAHPKVASLISGAVPDFDQCQQILQKVALSCLRNFNEYDRQRPFVEWALEIARREILNFPPKRPATFSASPPAGTIDRQRP
ncbi:MAG: hypothetical protein L0Z50_21000 [Verrucomicrobiales bacterium]|nr:hypothetical protein [Verrucomicrobiales bacterium]